MENLTYDELVTIHNLLLAQTLTYESILDGDTNKLLEYLVTGNKTREEFSVFIESLKVIILKIRKVIENRKWTATALAQTPTYH